MELFVANLKVLYNHAKLSNLLKFHDINDNFQAYCSSLSPSLSLSLLLSPSLSLSLPLSLPLSLSRSPSPSLSLSLSLSIMIWLAHSQFWSMILRESFFCQMLITLFFLIFVPKVTRIPITKLGPQAQSSIECGLTQEISKLISMS